jgi:hypothetical protein
MLSHEGFDLGPVYHGGHWDGKKRMRTGGRGALGVGAYFTPIRSVAEEYAKESGGQVTETYLRIKNPLRLDHGNGTHPLIVGFVKLGMDEGKAARMVEREEEKHGYIGSQLKNLALHKGYDGICLYFKGALQEIVAWTPEQILHHD